MKEQCDEILKQYEHLVSVKPPTHPNPNVVPICKSVRNIGRSLRPIIIDYYSSQGQEA